MAEFSVATSSDDGQRVVLTLTGDLDVHNAPLARDLIAATLGQGRATLVLDLSAVSFADSSGLGVLVGALKAARVAGCSLVLQAPSPRLRHLLAVTGLNRVFDIVEGDPTPA